MIYLRPAYYKWLWQAIFSPNVKFHPASFALSTKLSPYVYLDANTVLVNSFLGSYSYVSRGATLLNTNVGRYCSIGPECRIGMGGHPTNLMSTSPVFYSMTNKIGVSLVRQQIYEEFQSVEIGNDVWLGSRAMIMPGCNIGNGAIVAAGAVVTCDVKPYTIVGGVPAKEIRLRFDKATINLMEKSEWWELDHKGLKEVFDSDCEGSVEWSHDVAVKVCSMLIGSRKE